MAKNKKQLDPTALALEDTVRLLAASGSKHVTAETIQADIDAGAPTNPDGTINLVHYAAWLVKRSATHNRAPGEDA